MTTDTDQSGPAENASAGLMGGSRKRTRLARCLTVAALAWCALVLLGQMWQNAWTCHTDTSYCVDTRHKDGFYAGTLRDAHERPIRNRAFTVDLHDQYDPYARPVGGFSTDKQGRYCVRWTDVGDRYTSLGPELADNWRSDSEASVPDGCQSGDSSINWRSAYDYTSAPQNISMWVVLPVTGLLLLLGHAIRRVRIRRVIWRAGLGMTVLSTVWFFVVW